MILTAAKWKMITWAFYVGATAYILWYYFVPPKFEVHEVDFQNGEIRFSWGGKEHTFNPAQWGAFLGKSTRPFSIEVDVLGGEAAGYWFQVSVTRTWGKRKKVYNELIASPHIIEQYYS